MKKLFGIFARDPILPAAGLLALLSMLLVAPDARYLSYLDSKVLICLFSLMLAVELFQEAHLFASLAGRLVNRAAGMRRLSIIVVGMTFFFSMLLTNDVALITLVPLSILLFSLLDDQAGLSRVIILQTIAANVGSALTPIGNPQNLFLYTHYRLSFGTFIRSVWPVGLIGALVLFILIVLAPDHSLQAQAAPVPVILDRGLILAGVIFVAAIGCVFNLWNEWILLLVTLAALLPLKPKTLLKADYGLLLTFIFFFILIGNLSRLAFIRDSVTGVIGSGPRVMLAGALLSQLISNVPAAVLLSGFTREAGPLLRGVDVGGCGTLVASLASIISYKIYIRGKAYIRGQTSFKPDRKRYLLLFTGYNLLFLFVLAAVSLAIPY
jgi:Na+/H+ antiporter NhaD/arsenite permease-like protein